MDSFHSKMQKQDKLLCLQEFLYSAIQIRKNLSTRIKKGELGRNQFKMRFNLENYLTSELYFKNYSLIILIE